MPSSPSVLFDLSFHLDLFHSIAFSLVAVGWTSISISTHPLSQVSSAHSGPT